MFNWLDREGVWWRLKTLRDLLHSYATHAIPEMLAPDGARCGPYTRSVLRRRRALATPQGSRVLWR